ncbi:MAG: NTP transferase domain-containing protein [Akkermansiaceae bacterium]
MNNCLKGLLLVGGKSSRMGSDKAELVLRDGVTQRERGMKLLESICDKVFVSCADDEGEGSIADAFGNIGPLGAIASAQQEDPDSAWLVLACDLPLLETKHLTALIKGRDTGKAATCFTSATDGLPEPLCSIWEPSSVQDVSAAVQSGKRCPRSVLKQLPIRSLPSPGLWPLANSNSESDLLEVRNRINGELTQKTIVLSYYAQLREITGKSDEPWSTDCVSPAGVFEEIRAKYQLPIKRKGMMVAVDGDFTDWSHPISDGEEIVFIPPVAGG